LHFCYRFFEIFHRISHIKLILSFEGLHTTSGFVQLGLDGRTIIGNAYPSFGFGGRYSAGLLLVYFGF
jgi:hypothetical protein